MRTLRSEAVRRDLLVRLNKLAASNQPLWGRMSAHRMVCHLRDSYQLALGERAAKPATGFLQRTLAKWGALWLPVHWPKGYPTRPEVEQGNGGSRPGEFAADKRQLVEVFNRFCDELREPCIPHPIFGPMRLHEWLRWGYLHADHHLRQFGR